MSFSFAKIGFWRLIALGIALDAVHFVLRHRYPDLSPHYFGVRGAWAKVLMLSEYLVMMVAFFAAVSTAEIMLRNRNYVGALAIICALIAYFTVYYWVWK